MAMENNNDKLFFRLWRNIVINRIIFKYVVLYKKNKIVVFEDLDLFRDYKEKEYITTLKLQLMESKNNYKLLVGDLPEYGALKEIDLTSSIHHRRVKITSNAIPQGVEIIHFNVLCNGIQLSELPNSVNTITNVLLKRPYIDNQIPENITSISFSYLMDRDEFKDIKFPNSIKHLNCLHFPTIYPFPSNVTNLSITYDSNSTIIPKSVTILSMLVLGKLKSGSIPFGVKELTILGSDEDMCLTVDTLPKSITKLYMQYIPQIQPNIIPNSVTELSISFSKPQKSFKDVLPNGLTKFVIYSDIKPYDIKKSELPKTIKSLYLNNREIKLTGYFILDYLFA